MSVPRNPPRSDRRRAIGRHRLTEQVQSGARNKQVSVEFIYLWTLTHRNPSLPLSAILVLSLDELARRNTSVPRGKYGTLNTFG